MYNSNTFHFSVPIFSRDASNNIFRGLDIRVNGDGTNAELNVKGENTFNSNFYGIYTSQSLNANNLEINVESDATLTTCGNGRDDIRGNVAASSTLDFSFSRDGYTCDLTKVSFIGPGAGNVVPPTCQDCP